MLSKLNLIPVVLFATALFIHSSIHAARVQAIYMIDNFTILNISVQYAGMS
jgi:hypothetical protein